MKESSALRRFAAWLLRWCHRLSPPSVHDWGEAMLSELEFVEGNWPALAWAAGGAGVLMKRSLIHFVTGRRESAATAGGPAHRDPVLGGASMRKTTAGFAILGVAMLAVLLFAPSFRQAVSVSSDSLLWGFRLTLRGRGNLDGLVKKARAEGDAQTLAFAALETGNSQLADEAIKLDPKLTWIRYRQAALAMWLRRDLPAAEGWINKLKAWDPDNAVPHLMEAQLEALQASGGNVLKMSPEQLSGDKRFMSAMAAGFSAPKYDSYLGEELDLDRAMMARHHVTSPLIALGAYSSHPPAIDLVMLERFADLIYARGGQMEKTGNLEGASHEYWKVAQFGQAMHLGAATDFERQRGVILEREACKKLELLAAGAGRSDQQAFLVNQIRLLSPPHQGFRNNGFWMGVYSWNAEAGQIGLLILIFSVLLLASWGVYLAAGRILARGIAGRHESYFRVAGFVGGLGLLISSVTIYICYHPFAALFKQFSTGSGLAHADGLSTFWSFGELPTTFRFLPVTGDVYGWSALLAFAALLFAIEVYRFFSSFGPARETV